MSSRPETYPVPVQDCPSCGARCEAGTSVHHRSPPKKGDVVVCVCCASVLIYGPALFLRKPTPAEGAYLQSDPELVQTVAAVAEFIRQKGPHA